tara:strand:- start:2531 stop:2773 length:243 start_codon:yes stop_codon:yes gene_type:complete
MKLIKTQDFGFSNRKVYDLGKSTAKGWGDNPRKILVVTWLETGQETECRYTGNYTTDYDGDVRLNLAQKPYSTKVKGYDY